MTRGWIGTDRSGAAFGDVVIVLSVIVLGFSLIYPRLSENRFHERLDQAAADVEIVRAAAQSYFDSNADWPDPGGPGEASAALATSLPPGFAMRTEQYVLEWIRWEVVVPPEVVVIPEPAVLPDESPLDSLPDTPPPTIHAVGGVALHTGDSSMLAGLLERYGRRTAFIRDTTFTLVLPTKSAPRGGS